MHLVNTIRPSRAAGALALALAMTSCAPSGMRTATTGPRASPESFTRHELLDPGTADYRYRVDLVNPFREARTSVRPLPDGANDSTIMVRNGRTGQSLAFEILESGRSGCPGGESGMPSRCVRVDAPRDLGEDDYLLRIDMLVRDPSHYFVRADTALFRGTVGEGTDEFLLPVGWDVACALPPATRELLGDGRVKLVMHNWMMGEPDDFVIKALPRGSITRRDVLAYTPGTPMYADMCDDGS